jgi:hypothetical protein
MSSVQSSNQPIQLQWNGGAVVITPEDEDRFVKEAQWAVTAYQGLLAFERLFEQFKREFLPTLHDWCGKHAEAVASCYVPLPLAPCIKVFLVGALNKFDFQLSDAVSDFEVELERAGWPTDIVQLPATSSEMLRSFFDPVQSIQVYGNASRAPIESGSQPGVS